MGFNEKPVQLKVYVDKKKKKVMFAVAEEDFVEILLSFFTLPLGTIAKLSRKHANDIKLGSLTSIYESVVDLNHKHFSHDECKDALLNPFNSSISHCQKLKVNLDERGASLGGDGDAVFLKTKANFIITDDLHVFPFMLDTSIVLFNSLGVQSINLLEERRMCFGFEEFSDLLKWSLLTNNPLTNLVIGGCKPCSSFFTNPKLIDSASISSTSGKIQMIKLLVHKSNKNVLCAQVENGFVELLFSFLTIPLGTFVRLTKGDSSPMGIINLYDSISNLGDGNYLKSEDVKTVLLSPKLSDMYQIVTELLPIYEENIGRGQFLKEQARFIVSDDLEVTISQSIDIISKFNTLGVPVGDMEVLEVTIGEQEALLLLKASLTSTSALTDCLDLFRKKLKDNVPVIDFAEDGVSDLEEFDFLEEENDIDASFVMVD
ncbi:hypothetical protein LXL04_036055 [Taraxacum kok-saghyz]